MSSQREMIHPSEGSYLLDDFISNDAVTDNAIGQLGWQITNIANAPTLAYQTAHGHGVLRATTAATANGDGGAIHLFPDGLILRPGVEFGARVRMPVELTGANFRVGLDDSVTATRPTVGITVESDAGVLTCATDSADHGDESLAVTGVDGLTSGTTMVVGEWLQILVKCAGKANAQGGPQEVDFFLGSVAGNAPAKMHHVAKLPCNIDDDEEVEPKFAFWQDTGSADAIAFDIDYYWLWIPRVP